MFDDHLSTLSTSDYPLNDAMTTMTFNACTCIVVIQGCSVALWRLTGVVGIMAIVATMAFQRGSILIVSADAPTNM